MWIRWRVDQEEVRGEEMALARMLRNSWHDVTVWSAIEKEVEDFSKSLELHRVGENL